ncbi:MAG: DEAD/DEAH box helicase [Eubacteriales bacterium]|nr:DEAD/DEAH box helicase [Eubacteriales bacterium]
MKFEEMNIIAPILKAIKAVGYTEPTAIQEKAIPVILEGRDLIGCAQTGTGKTAAFSVPVLQILYKKARKGNETRSIRALILTPTRELAAQIDESLTTYGKYTGLRHTVVYGGVSQFPQTRALKAGVDILVATPGRLLDLMNQKFIDLSSVEFFVLDEADRMLDMGFMPDVKRIMSKLPEKRQTLLFSATIPAEITKLSNTILTDPVRVEISPSATPVDSIEQSVYFVDQKDKKSLLIKLLKNTDIDLALVFTRTKHGADRVVKILEKEKIAAQAIHGDKSQGARQMALKNFKQKRTRVLVATDIASRGIDVQELSYVINYDMPSEPETYVHRIGRTGRAGLSGTALSFCGSDERRYLRDIQKLISRKIPVNKEMVLATANAR